jgi:hypothetical protein
MDPSPTISHQDSHLITRPPKSLAGVAATISSTAGVSAAGAAVAAGASVAVAAGAGVAGGGALSPPHAARPKTRAATKASDKILYCNFMCNLLF